MANAVLEIVSNNDFVDDVGLIVCGKCGEKKQIKLNFQVFGGKEKIVHTACCCEHEKYEKEREVFEEKRRILHINRLKDFGITDKNYLRYTFANDGNKTPKISAACKKYADNFPDMFAKNNGLIFFGNVGTSKTFFAVCIATQCLSRGKACLLRVFQSCLTSFRKSRTRKIKF